jgi:predicted flap endonuclease-1-like 5' DNA nuclease
MGFFLEKTWMWWLLSAVLAAFLTWLVLRRQDRTAADGEDGDAADGAGTAAGAASADGGRRVHTPARGLALRAGASGGDAEVAALRAEVDMLRVRADDAEMLRTRIVTLKVDADRTTGLEEEVRLLRLRLEGEDGQVAVLKRRIALLEVEASRVPDLERELERAGRSPSTRTLGQVVQQAAGLPDDAPSAGAAPTVDDLKLVEGIGPKIEGLLQADGIRTWRQLADAHVERLQRVLAAAGPRYQLHDPTSWPQQADLLDRGDLQAFAALTGRLDAGR